VKPGHTHSALFLTVETKGGVPTLLVLGPETGGRTPHIAVFDEIAIRSIYAL